MMIDYFYWDSFDKNWFVDWALKKGLSTRVTNNFLRWMVKRKCYMNDFVNLDKEAFEKDIASIRGFGPKSIKAFMSVYDDLKKDWLAHCEEVYS